MSLTDDITLYAQEKHLSTQTLARWRAWREEDQAAFLTVARELRLGENQVRDLLDWLEEIILRDGGTIGEVLARPEIRRSLAQPLSRNDKLKLVKEAVRKLRYPRLSQLEDNLRAAVKALDLGPRVRVSLPPTLEGDEVTIALTVRGVQELRDNLERLAQRVENGAFQRVFGLLDQV